MKRAVLSGSYKRDKNGLRYLYYRLITKGYEILSPHTVYFDKTESEFVTNSSDYLLSNREIELMHLTSIVYADELWLHLPDGYVGNSTALEIGFAIAHRKRIIATQIPNDELIAQFVEIDQSM